jgi:hypothetical protein
MVLVSGVASIPRLIGAWRLFRSTAVRAARALRHPPKAKDVRRFLEAERFRLIPMSMTADRAMRTRAARARAQAVRASILDWMAGRSVREGQQAMLQALSERAGWTRRSGREFVFEFGGRHTIIIVPQAIDVEQFIATVTRAEVSVVLGDCDWRILKELQSLAARELQQLAESE